MPTVYYKNISDEILKAVPDDYRLLEYKNIADIAEDAALLLIGGNVSGLIRTVQSVNETHPYLGVLILSAEPDTHRLKMAIQFSPFINQDVKIIEASDTQKVLDILPQEAAMALKRKKFSKTQDRALAQLSSALKSDHFIRNKFLDKFLLQAPVGAVLLNKGNIILDLNAFAAEVLSEGREILAKPFDSIFGADKGKVQKFLEAGPSPNESIQVRLEINTEKFVKLYMSQVDTATAFYKMVIVLDVTREVILQRSARQYLQEVEKRNKELKQFANVLSHDLKNPLSNIQLSCEMAAEASFDQKDKYLDIIYRSSENLMLMMQGLEKIIDVRNDEHVATKLTFKRTFENVLNEYQFQIKEENITITTDFKVRSITYVESFLISIFQNMISNAIKYRKENQPLTIHIDTAKRDKCILLRFIDNGIGIDLDRHRDDLFQPFKRFTSRAEGKGIGLSIIKSMIEKNNGKIEVESVPGIGTTFLCFLRDYS